jgi:two-component system CheB/CheR fusion protein
VESRPVERQSYGDVHQRLREQAAPPSILVNEEYDILHFADRAERYFHFSGNEISRNLLKLIRPELRLELRTAFYQAAQQQTTVEVRGLTLPIGGQSETLALQVRPYWAMAIRLGGVFWFSSRRPVKRRRKCRANGSRPSPWPGSWKTS